MTITQGETLFKKQISQKFEILKQNLNRSNKNYNKIRQEAFDIFLSKNFPTTKQEDWKYSNLRKILKQSFNPFDNGKVLKKDLEKSPLNNLNAYKLVFVNGHYRKDLSNSISEDGIIISNLKEAWLNNASLINQYLPKPDSKSTIFTSLNAAFTQDGAFIYIEKSKVVEKPIIILDISDTRQNHIISNPCNLVIASENVQLSIINENIVLGDKSYLKNSVTNLHVSKNANVRHYKVQNLTTSASHIETLNVHQENDSTFTDTSITLSGELIRNNINIDIHGEHCQTNMNGLFVLINNDHVDIKTSVNHLKPNSNSNELYKGILGGSSTGVFNGKIFVRSEAQKTNAFQLNKNILLSDMATINTKPQLQIWADDVKCSHGITTGALDKEQLFYLRSRGIRKDKARTLLVKAFASEVFERISFPELKEYVQTIVEEQIYKA